MLNFRIAKKVTHSTIKTSRAYSSVWNKDARLKHRTVTDVVGDELRKTSFCHLLLAAPTVDITNLDTSNIKPEDSTEEFKHKVEESCRNMLKVAAKSS